MIRRKRSLNPSRASSAKVLTQFLGVAGDAVQGATEVVGVGQMAGALRIAKDEQVARLQAVGGDVADRLQVDRGSWRQAGSFRVSGSRSQKSCRVVSPGR